MREWETTSSKSPNDALCVGRSLLTQRSRWAFLVFLSVLVMSFAVYGQGGWKKKYVVFTWSPPLALESGIEIDSVSLGYLLYVTDKNGRYRLYDSTLETKVVAQFKKGCFKAYVIAYRNDSVDYLESEPSQIEGFCIR